MNRLFNAVIIFCLLLLNIAGIWWLGQDFKNDHQTEPIQWGVSFSQKYAEELGLNWQASYERIIKGLGVQKLRLMSYWDRHEPANNRYDFSELDWMMDQAADRQLRVSLAIGLRQPRWPECHQPDWTDNLSPPQYNQELLNYLAAVVDQYKTHPALESWQLENEASNQLFGSCRDFDQHLYQQEYELVKAADPSHPLITSASNQAGVPLKEPTGDKIGFSLYNHATPTVWGQTFKWTYWYVPASWHSFRAKLVETLHGSPAFIHELQAEPWGRVATHKLTKDEQYKLMSPAQLKTNVDFAQRAGFREIYLWGAEWWDWRKTSQHDPAIWQTAQSIFKNR